MLPAQASHGPETFPTRETACNLVWRWRHNFWPGRLWWQGASFWTQPLPSLPARRSLSDGASQQWLLGKQPRGPGEAHGNRIKTRTSGSQAGAARSTDLATSTCLSSAASSPPRWSSPVCLNLPYPVEQLHFFMGRFHLLLIQFSHLFDLKALPLVFLNNRLGGRCSVQKSELLQTQDNICFYLGTKEKKRGEQSYCSSSTGLWDHTAPSTYSWALSDIVHLQSWVLKSVK